MKYDIKVYVDNQVRTSFINIDGSSFHDVYSQLISGCFSSEIDYSWLCRNKARVIIFGVGCSSVNYYFDCLLDYKGKLRFFVDIC